MKKLTVITAIGILMSVAPHLANAQSYTAIDLGSFGGDLSIATGVNDKGQVSGIAFMPESGVPHAFLSGAVGGGLKDIGTLTGKESEALGVNKFGQVVGLYWSSDAAEDYKIFLTANNGYTPQDHGTMGPWAQGSGVNDAGQMCGNFDFGPGDLAHAFISAPGGGALRDLGTLGGNESEASSINALGQVTGDSNPVGVTDPTLYHTHAFLSGPNGGPLKDLGTMGMDFSFGLHVNINGQVVGYAGTGYTERPFVSDADGGTLHDLGTFGGYTNRAFGINDAGDIVGLSNDINTQPHPWLYRNGVMTDLNTLIDPVPGLLLVSATAISNTGFITAAGSNSILGQTHAFLLAPYAPGLAAPTGLTATGHDTTVELHWTPVSGAASYIIYRSTSPDTISNRPLDAGIVGSYIDTGRKNGITYYYKIAAENRSGISQQSAVASATPAP